MQTPPRSVLIIRLSAIGDVIHALPLLDLLHEQLPGARIGWLIEELSAPILEHHPHVDHVHVIPRRRWRGNFHKLFHGEIMPFYTRIRNENWDASIDLQGISKSALAAWACGAAKRIGFAGDNSRELNFLFNRSRVAPRDSDIHIVEQNIRLLEGLGITIPEKLPRGTIHLLDSEKEEMRRMLEAVGWGGEKLLAVNPGAGFVTKRWALPNYVEVGRELIRRSGYRPIITWGPGEEKMRDFLAGELKGERVLVAPPTGVRQMTTLISLCSFFLGGDTGPTHIAGIFGVPVLSIFGATNAARNCPWPSRGPDRAGMYIQREDLECIPCRKRTCPLGGAAHLACLTGLSPPDVLARATPWLDDVLR